LSVLLKYPFQKIALSLKQSGDPQAALHRQTNRLVEKTLWAAFRSSQRLSTRPPTMPENWVFGTNAQVFTRRQGDERLVVVPLAQPGTSLPGSRLVNSWPEFAVLRQSPGRTEVVRRTRQDNGSYRDVGQRFQWVRERGVWIPRWDDPINISGSWRPGRTKPASSPPNVTNETVNPYTTDLYRSRVTTDVGRYFMDW